MAHVGSDPVTLVVRGSCIPCDSVVDWYSYNHPYAEAASFLPPPDRPTCEAAAQLRFRFTSRHLLALYTEEKGARKYPPSVVDAFFAVVASIESALDERDLYALKGLRYEKLKGSRQHQRSLRLNDQFRLVVETEEDSQGHLVAIIDIEDYHR